MENGTTVFSFGSLPKYKVDSEGEYILDINGNVQLNKYTVVETTTQKAYDVSYGDVIKDDEGNFEQNVINSIKQEKINLTVNKTWIDEGIANNRPSITVKLYKNDREYSAKTITNEESSCTFENLPKYTFGTDEHGNPTCVENQYRVEEVSVSGYITNNGTLNKNGTEWTQTITNKISQTTTSVTVKKVWNAPNITEHPDIKINLYQNDSKTPYRTTTLSAGGDKVWQDSELTYTWNDLPKYLVDTNGNYILDSNGNVQLNKYTTQEEEIKTYNTSYSEDTYEITNTAKGILQVTSISTTQTENKVPADVVFVLDISGSMCEENSSVKGTSRAKDMVDAVNSAISTVMTNNPNSRIAVVTYSTKATQTWWGDWDNKNNATTILELGTYTPKNGSTEYLKCSQGHREWDITKNAYVYEDVKISTNVKEKATKTVNVTGGTYTQGGIAMGANILANADAQYDPDGNGPMESVTRTPILILLSDGEPTCYTTEYSNVGEIEGGDGSSTTVNEAYYTIRTAVEYKKDIVENYGTANMYTIGFGADTLLLRTILNPDKTNIDRCGGSYYGSVAKSLYNKLKETQEGIYGFDYADASYTTGSISSEELANLLNKYINLSQPHNSYRIFTETELENKRVDLTDVDIDATSDIEDFISYGNTTYTFEEAINRGIVKIIGNNEKYYVDLSTVDMTEQVYLKYQTIPENV